MHELNDKKLLQKYLVETDILTHFTKRPKDIRLVRYEKGELITDPLKPLTSLMFVVSGTVSIYGIHEDGSRYGITVSNTFSMLGDMEFSGHTAYPFFSEALSIVDCVSIPFFSNKDQLNNDNVFLRYMVSALGEKLELSTQMELVPQTLEDKLLFYLREQTQDHMITSVNETMMRLHCSRRQLQRVLQKLCAEGTIIKTGKGTYRLLPYNI